MINLRMWVNWDLVIHGSGRAYHHAVDVRLCSGLKWLDPVCPTIQALWRSRQ